MNLREIANRAKVSIATVSRTINRVPTVRPVNARRVQRIIDEVGYYPNTHARALVSGRSRIFGLMVSEITNPFFPEIVQTFEDLGVEHKYEILLSSITNNPARLEMAARRMIELRVDGVAILTFGNEDPLIEAFRRHKVPAVAIDIEPSGSLFRSVHIDYRHGIRQAVQHLAALGHARIAFIAGPAHLKTTLARRLAFQECMTEIGLKVPPEFVIEGDHTMESGMRDMSALTAAPLGPSAVICSNDMTAIGVMREAFELTLKIPAELSVVGFDDTHFAQFTTPPLTTVRMSQAEIARLAFRALLELVETQRNRPLRETYTIKTDLVIRGSTAIAPDRLKQAGSQRGHRQSV
ncbi:MAG: LacI family DNA-binding transcriptional regulator [Candidatus Acidiferrum sp.]